MTHSSELPRFESPAGPVVRIDGREYLYFSGTAYLGLQARREVVAAAAEAVTRYGIHSATSRLRAGVSPPVADVETEAARFFGKDAAVHCASGYLAPWMLLQAIAGQFDLLLLDSRAHPCLLDAAACSGLPREDYGAHDAGGFRRRMAAIATSGLRPLVMTDGVFSATGELAPLDAVVTSLAQCPGSGLLVDDAHGLGAIGPNGRGTLDAFGLWPSVNQLDERSGEVHLFCCGTLGKALGGYGGIVPCDLALSAAIRQRSNVYRGAAPPAAPTAAASARALRLAQDEPELRQRLASNVSYLQRGLERLGIEGSSSCAPIRAVSEFRGHLPARLHQALLDRAIYVPHVSSYGGAGEGGVLRIAVFANHTTAHLDALLSALDEISEA